MWKLVGAATPCSDFLPELLLYEKYQDAEEIGVWGLIKLLWGLFIGLFKRGKDASDNPKGIEGE